MVTWDETKRRQNLAKHGLDLADAERFDFETAVIDEDRDVRYEQRFRAIGWVQDRLCYLIYAVRGDDIRAISLRPAERKDRRYYAEELQRRLHP